MHILMIAFAVVLSPLLLLGALIRVLTELLVRFDDVCTEVSTVGSAESDAGDLHTAADATNARLRPI